MNNDQPLIDGLRRVADVIATKQNADVVVLNGPMYTGFAEIVESVLLSIVEPRPRLFLILVTNGGDADTAYCIARAFQRRYKKVTICIAGDCYSAGSLVVLGANDLIMADTGKLGPLDVQILKKDEIGERLSGLTHNIAMGELQSQVFTTFEHFLWQLKSRFRSQLSLRMAMDVAAKMATDLYSEIYKQIDPLKLGEDARAMHIAEHYGELLSQKSQNVKERAISRLLEDYPSHSCVIDREEAKELFKSLREADDDEWALLELLGPSAKFAEDDPNEAMAFVLSSNLESVGQENEQVSDENTSTAADGTVELRVNGATQQRNSARTSGRNGAAGASRKRPDETRTQ